MKRNLTQGECNALIDAIDKEYVLVGRPLNQHLSYNRLYIVRYIRGGYIMRNADQTDRTALLMKSKQALEMILQSFLAGIVLYDTFDWYAQL